MVFIPSLIDKEYHYYAAKLLITKSINKDNSVEKTYLIIYGLTQYNKFLKRNLNLQIKDNDKIYSTVTSNPLNGIDIAESI